jgi:hypothetical protein
MIRGDSYYRLHPREFERLRADWMAGKAFFEGKTLHGADCVIKLAGVEIIQLQTPETIQSVRAEEAADKADDAIEGCE